MRARQYKEIELLVALSKLAAREHRPLSDLIFEAIYEYLKARSALPSQRYIALGKLRIKPHASS